MGLTRRDFLAVTGVAKKGDQEIFKREQFSTIKRDLL